ncbi:MAG: ATP-binding protein [Pseudomonadota bacterium]
MSGKNFPIIKGDRKQIYLLFFHLLDNAKKFRKDISHEHEISVSWKKLGSFYRFTIKDNGIGIDDMYQEKIFKLFYQTNPEQYEGDGVGLTFARKIIQKHGGEFTLQSKLDEGTLISFTLPCS